VSSCSAVDPVAQVIPGRLYNFCVNVDGQQILFSDIRASGGRHPFIVNGGASSSGIVFTNGESTNQLNSAEAHRWYSTSVLFERISMSGESSLGILFGLYNRGDFGSGHGWYVMQTLDVHRPC
jgi:hypothetical protein